MASVDLSSVTTCQDELNEEFVAPTVMVGRTLYQRVLLEAYQKVIDSQEPCQVFVHGVSGSGKTTLVDATLREKVCAEGQGYFCSGKFFQNSGEPYAAILSAFSDLRDLVIQSERFTEKRRAQIREGLLQRPEEARLLGRMINLTPLLGEVASSSGGLVGAFNNDGDTVVQDVAFAKFKSACKTFLLTLASEQAHPVVLFLDDIQWIDDCSQQVISMLLRDDNLRNVLLLFAYREEEADKVNDLRTPNCIDVQVENLDLSGVHALVCTHLGYTASEVLDLSKLIEKRTKGNPFYVLQFMDAIVREQLLRRNDDGSWSFSVVEIQQEIMVTEGVADLLHQTIQQLSPQMKTTLTIASVFGYVFDSSTLVRVAAELLEETSTATSSKENDASTISSTESIKLCLTSAIKAGFVEKLDQQSYQFCHDKLQSAFLSFADDSERERLHYLIGESFLLSGGDDDTATAYSAAVHFNDALQFFSNRDERIKLTRINLKAAQYCKEGIAFDAAAELLRRGLDLLDSRTMWEGDLFDLTFEMTVELARMELAAGRFDSCKEVAAECLRRAKSIDMKITPLMLGVESRIASNETSESIAAARHALQILKVTKYPNRVSLRHVIPKLVMTKRKMARTTDSDILKLPAVQDRKVATTVWLLSHICIYSLMSNDDKQAVYAGLTAMDLTLQYGLTPYSSTALTVFGMTEVMFGHHDRAYRCGKLAMKLLHNSNNKDAECPTVGFATTVLLHWKEPLTDIVGLLAQAGCKGLEKGDFVYGSWCFWQALIIDTYQGQNLSRVRERYQIQYDRCSALGGQNILGAFIEVSLQFVANLQSDSTDWKQLTALNGEYVKDEAAYIQAQLKTNNMLLYTSALWSTAQLACFFGLYDVAAKKYKAVSKVGKTAKLSYAASAWFEFAGVIHYEQFRASRRPSSLRKARRCKRKLGRMKATGSPNTTMACLDVKELSLREDAKDPAALIAEFDSAIELLAGNPIFQSMAAEDAGFTLARLGQRKQAEKYFHDALVIYRNVWGSRAKYQWLQEKSAEALDGLAEESCPPLVGDVITFGNDEIHGGS